MQVLLKDIIRAFLKWRIKHINDRRFVVILSLCIGLLVGLAAAILKWILAAIESQIHEGSLSYLNKYFFFALPMIGVGLTILFIRTFLKGRLPNGISYLLFRIGRKSSKIGTKHTYGHVITSAITVAFGGSVGLEGPMVMTGSAIGSNLGYLVHLNRQKRMLLIGCGSSAAIASIFNAPIAGVIFTLEVILSEMKVGLLVPLLIASVTGTTVSKLLIGDKNTFIFNIIDKIEVSDYPYFILLGLICGGLSVYFIRIHSFFLKKSEKTINKTKKWLIGGISLGFILAIFPSLYGEGYWTIKTILKGNAEVIVKDTFFSGLGYQEAFLMGIVLFSILLKPIATSLTKMAGGVGGVFAPSLLMGGLSGFLVSRLINLSNIGSVSEQNFTLVGMAGVASGLLHSPLTAIFLIAELTNGYELFVPLMLVSAIAYGTSYYFEKHSFYTKSLAERGDLINYDKDKTVLTTIGVKQVIERDLKTVPLKGVLQDLVNAISESKRNIFPVIDENKMFKGVILLDDVRQFIFKPELYQEKSIIELMHDAPEIIEIHEPMDMVMNKFDLTGAWNLPVVSNGKYVGFVSKSKIFNSYRKRLKTENDL